MKRIHLCQPPPLDSTCLPRFSARPHRTPSHPLTFSRSHSSPPTPRRVQGRHPCTKLLHMYPADTWRPQDPPPLRLMLLPFPHPPIRHQIPRITHKFRFFFFFFFCLFFSRYSLSLFLLASSPTTCTTCLRTILLQNCSVLA